MNAISPLIEQDVLAYLRQHEQKELLRFITCGSVDDGKSTLIGRLLHDSKMIFEDQLAAISADSRRVGTTGDEVDLALLVDGLQSEREQGITIDVAYRYFSTDKRKFIIADTPGHEQYTRNMVTGASTADLAIILVDARYGVQTQTKRHSYLVSLLGIKQVIVAINKMDLVDYQQEVFDQIQSDYAPLADQLGLASVHFLPLSALRGDNVVERSSSMPWYSGQPLIELLETLPITQHKSESLRLPIQYVNRPNGDFRGYSGTLASGSLAIGDEVLALPSGNTSRVESLVTFDGHLTKVTSGQAITVTLEDEIDLSRGDMLVHASGSANGSSPNLSNQFDASLVWFNESKLAIGREYQIKLCSQTAYAKVERLKSKIDINTLAIESDCGDGLSLNEIGEAQISVNRPLVFDPYQAHPKTGSFILIDRLTHATVAAGMIIRAQAGEAESQPPSFSAFELELNALIRKHFPHWDAKDISRLGKL